MAAITKQCLKTGIKLYPRLSFEPSATIFTKSSQQLELPEYGGKTAVTMVPGDGIGPELMQHVRNVFSFMGAPVDFQVAHLDVSHSTEQDFENVMKAIKRTGVALKGSIESKYGSQGGGSRNALMRRELHLFCNLLECKSFPALDTRHQDIDITVIRQNTEAEYSLLEHETEPGSVESLKIITREESERIATFAFKYAQEFNRKRVTCIHKANIMKAADGLFLETCRNVAQEYPDIEFKDMIVDNMSMQLVSQPHQFDVLLCPNLYGTVASNIVCGLIGGAGLLSGRNYGYKYAVFEPGTRNTGTGIAGKNIANPIAMMNAAADLLEYIELKNFSLALRDAIHKTVNIDKLHTIDLHGNASCSQVVDRLMQHLAEDPLLNCLESQG